MSGTANAVLADAKFPQGTFACIITEYPIFIGLGISSMNGTKAGSIRQRNDGAHHQYCSRFGNGSHELAAHADSQLRSMQPWASSTHISFGPNLGAYSYGNHFEFTIIVDSGH